MPQKRNNSKAKGTKKRAVSASPSRATVPICGFPGKTGKPCKQTILTESGRCSRHASEEGAPIVTEKALGPGAPLGSQNARKHGLFSASLGPQGQDAYEMAKELPPEALAREAADFAIAKVAEVFAGNPEVKGVIRLVDDFLEGLVLQEELSYEAKTFIMRRLAEPDIASMGKALSPIKALLEVKPRKNTEGGTNALQALADVVKRSQTRRDAEAKEGGAEG